MRSGKFFMGMIYRGYPTVWQAAVGAEEIKKEPYVLNQKESCQTSGADRRKLREEQEYFKGIYPLHVKQYQAKVDNVCDQYDHAGSFLYDEYPDRETLYQMRDIILQDAAESGMGEEKELTYVLLLGELERRRAVNKNHISK